MDGLSFYQIYICKPDITCYALCNIRQRYIFVYCLALQLHILRNCLGDGFGIHVIPLGAKKEQLSPKVGSSQILAKSNGEISCQEIVIV
jgi:hypothetical protein